jgi:hypothetical protein
MKGRNTMSPIMRSIRQRKEIKVWRDKKTNTLVPGPDYTVDANGAVRRRKA